MDQLALVALFVAALALGQAAVWASKGNSGHARQRARADGDPIWDREPPLAGSAWLADALEGVPGMLALQRLQSQAGNSWTSTTFLVLATGLAVVVQIGAMVLGAEPLLSVVLGSLAASAPFLVLGWQKDRRAARISDELPQALRALARLANTGQGPAQAIREAALELDGPLGRELGRTFVEQRDGRPLAESLRALTGRVPDSIDLRILVTAILLSSEVGGDLGGLLERIEETLSARIALAREMRAQQAQARLSAGILAALPPLGVLGVALVQPDYFLEGWEDPLGRVLYLAALVWMSIGLLIIALILRRQR